MTLLLCNKGDIEKYGISIRGGMEERRDNEKKTQGTHDTDISNVQPRFRHTQLIPQTLPKNKQTPEFTLLQRNASMPQQSPSAYQYWKLK